MVTMFVEYPGKYEYSFLFAVYIGNRSYFTS